MRISATRRFEMVPCRKPGGRAGFAAVQGSPQDLVAGSEVAQDGKAELCSRRAMEVE